MFSAENIVVLGAGKSGVGAAVLAQKKGKNVFVSDASSITLEYKSILNNYDIKWEENGLAKSDKIHFTTKGYKLTGDLFFEAFIKSYKEFLEKNGRF